MGTERLERVMWRLRKLADNPKRPLYHDLRKAIIYECGHSPQNYFNVKRALITLGWITAHSRKRFRITEKDLTDS